jgi:phage antirepressor YoqD-like protein
MAAKAKAADDEAKREFFEKVVDFSHTFSVKETSRLLKISVGWLRDYATERGITFPDPKTRTKVEQLAVDRQFEKIRPLKELRKVEPVTRALPGQIKLTPELEVLSRRALRRTSFAFHTRVIELAEVFSLHEAAKILNVSVRYLKNFGYEKDILFAGQVRAYKVNMVEPVAAAVASGNSDNPFLRPIRDDNQEFASRVFQYAQNRAAAGSSFAHC